MISHYILWLWAVIAGCDCGLWLWAVIVRCGCGLWLRPVIVGCDCGLWLWAVIACCDCLWLWAVIVSCGCGLWFWPVIVGCDRGLWLWAVIVGYDCGFWLCAVIVRCGYGLWFFLLILINPQCCPSFGCASLVWIIWLFLKSKQSQGLFGWLAVGLSGCLFLCWNWLQVKMPLACQCRSLDPIDSPLSRSFSRERFISSILVSRPSVWGLLCSLIAPWS